MNDIDFIKALGYTDTELAYLELNMFEVITHFEEQLFENVPKKLRVRIRNVLNDKRERPALQDWVGYKEEDLARLKNIGIGSAHYMAKILKQIGVPSDPSDSDDLRQNINHGNAFFGEQPEFIAAEFRARRFQSEILPSVSREREKRKFIDNSITLMNNDPQKGIAISEHEVEYLPALIDTLKNQGKSMTIIIGLAQNSGPSPQPDQ